MDMPSRQRLSADAWTEVALDALAEAGIAAVAVEPLAARLGTTKGSFYWHFSDRDSLVAATLALWEQRHTDAVISDLASVPEPRERLRLLLEFVLTFPAERDPVVALFSDSAHPLVAPVLERVTRRRVGYLTDQFVASGLTRAEARRRAAVLYAAYVGWWQLRAIVPDLTPPGRKAVPHARLLLRLIADLPAEPPPRRRPSRSAAE